MATHHDDSGPVHPVEAFVRASRRDLAALAEQPMWTLDAARTRSLVQDLAALVAQVAELEARVIGHAGDVGVIEQDGAASLVAWLRHHTKVSGGEASRKARLAGVGQQTRAALARGEVPAEQALVINAALAELGDLPVSEQERAEKHLLGEAAHHDTRDLRVLGRRILEHLDPARADAHEAALLAKQEARAAKATRMRMYDDGEGLTHGAFTILSAQASMLRKALHALAAPKHVRAVEGAGSYDHDKPTPARLGQAFVEYIERYPADSLPSMGGVSATVVVTVDHEVLLGEAKAAHLDTGVDVSPGQLRRWACEAGIIAAVMDSTGRVLDLGRTRRFHSPAQRIALALEQKHCQHPTCQTPAAFCHVHHTTPWVKGGTTTTRDAVLLCPFHHHRAHTDDQTYPMRT